jgi:hypothetical protein
MSDISSEKPFSVSSSTMDASSEQQFQDQLKLILDKLNSDPSTITSEEAHILSDNVTLHDERSVRIISAIECIAIANEVCIIRLPATNRLLAVPC